MNYILYHANCPDGFGAALAAWLKFGKDAEYIPVNYGKPPPEMQPGSDVYIVDFSYAAPILAEMGRLHKQVTVLDHHATAQNDLSHDNFVKLGLANPTLKIECGGFLMPCQNLQIKFDMTKSGAVLAWEFFHPNDPVPLFFQYLQDRDLWKFELTHSREVSAYLQTREMDFALWEYVMREMTRTDAFQEICRAGSACLKLKQQQVEIMARNHRVAMFDTKTQIVDISTADPKLIAFGSTYAGQHVAPVANATVFFSEVGEELLRLFPEAPFSAYYFDRSDGKRQWGFRSRPDFDCSLIAKAFGGGGHKQASGFIQQL